MMKSQQATQSQVEMIKPPSNGSNELVFDVIGMDMKNSLRSRSFSTSRSMKEYRQNWSVILIDVTNNFYFHILPSNIAIWWYYDIILSKWYPLLFLSIITLLTFLFLIFAIFFNDKIVYSHIASTTAFILSGIFGLSYNLGLNFDVMHSIFHTFDFWFKSINLIVVMIAEFILYSQLIVPLLNTRVPIYQCISALFAMSMLFPVVFMSDAAFITAKIKVCMLSAAVITCMGFAAYQFFTFNDDIIWYPIKDLFGLKNINKNGISLNNIAISGFTNIGLFVLKSIFLIIWHNNKKELIDAIKTNQNKEISISTRGSGVDVETVENVKNVENLKHVESKMSESQPSGKGKDKEIFLFRSSTVSIKPYFMWIHTSKPSAQDDIHQLTQPSLITEL